MKKISFLVLLTALVILICVPVVAQVMSGNGTPIKIVSDRFDLYSDKRIAVFSGNVVVTQEDTIIKSDEFYLQYKEKDAAPKPKEKNTNPGLVNVGEIEKIEAKGNVIIRQKDKVVTGNDAIFFYDEQKVIITGDPIMQEGDNIIKGERIIFFLKENRGIVESSSTRRVTATIYPEEKE